MSYKTQKLQILSSQFITYPELPVTPPFYVVLFLPGYGHLTYLKATLIRKKFSLVML